VRRSTNAGQSWLSDINNLSIGSNTCSGLDIVYDYQGLHVVYAIKASDPNYETYYYRINSGGSWVDYKNVTDYFDEVGGQPSVASSPEKVYVSYNTSVGSYIGLAKVRERNSGGWEIPETVMEWPLQSIFEKLAVRNNKLFLIWEKYYVIYPVQYADLMYQTRDLDEKDWTEPMLIEQDVWPDD